MKKLIIACLSLALVLPGASFAKGGHGGSHSSGIRSSGTGASHSKTHVSSYNKKDGTHVIAHNRSSKDRTKANNWSTKGNVNPETGKPGTK